MGCLKQTILLFKTQVLKEAAYVLPIVETYQHKRDQSIMLVLHNPYNTEMQNHVDWHTELHSNVGFRSVSASLDAAA